MFSYRVRSLMSSVTTKHTGFLSLHASVFIFGGTALFANFITLDAFWITWSRSLVAGLFLLLLTQSLGQWKQVEGTKTWGLWWLTSILLGAHWVTYFHSMQVSSVAVGMIALYTYPLITVFLEPWFTKDRLDIHDLLAAIAVVFGIVLIVPEFSWDNDISVGVFWGTISALFFSVRNLLQRYCLSGYSVKQSVSIQTLMIFVILSFYIMPKWSSVTMSWQQLSLMVVLGVVFTALPHTLFANSLKYLKAKSVSLIGCLQPVYGAVLAYIIFDEKVDWLVFLGGFIIISTAAYESIRVRK
jgi:drug/metabolite transporter (DMT)-like permease